ncbi:MAG: hypothetical protein R3B72_07365 [Polyangiaceae bacterium]
MKHPARFATSFLASSSIGLLLLAQGCGNEIITSGDGGAGGGSTSSGATGGGGASLGAGGADPVGVTIDCTAACAAPAEGACFESPDCEDFCHEHNGSWGEPGASAFSFCATNDFMCFEDFEGCTWRTLYPMGLDVTAELDGEGLFAFESLTIQARLDGSEQPLVSTLIADGAFHLDLTGHTSIIGGASAILWIDVDGDDICDASDVTAFILLDVEPPFEAPRLHGDVFADMLKQGGFGCELL